jgi:hypothetical protein
VLIRKEQRFKDQGSRCKVQEYKGNFELRNKVGGMDKLVCPWMFNFEFVASRANILNLPKERRTGKC